MVRLASPAKWQEWADRMERFERSGRSIRDFCAAEAVSPGTFWYWRRNLRKGGRPRIRPAPLGRPGFTPVEIVPRVAGNSVVIRLPGGASVELPADRPELLQAALEILTAEPSAC